MVEHIEIEKRLAAQGLNPIFGEWTREFDFPAVPYSSNQRESFKKDVKSHLGDVKFLYSHDIKLEITLYHFEQKRLETPEYGDLDNCAKAILDGIKGDDGLMIDDCQVQQLDICWIDIGDRERFEIRIKGSPDDFILKPTVFYEMPNGLFYPVSKAFWTQEGPDELNDAEQKALLKLLKDAVGKSKRLRHDLRTNGTSALRSFWESRKIHPVLQGFHKSRIVDGHFEIRSLAEWDR